MSQADGKPQIREGRPRPVLWVVVGLVLCCAAAVQADQVDVYVKSQMQKRNIPGLQLAVVHNGKVIKAQSYGLANVELNVRVTDDTMFEIASNSKQFTAGAILLLEQDRKLSLDDPITKYLPALPDTYSAITVRHLLSHTSGVKDYIEEFPLNRSVNYTSQELIERIGANQLNFPPGEDGKYSTTGYLLLGLIIERITGKPYGEFLRERIFTPLGMSRTRVIDLSEIIPNRAAGYRLENGLLRNGRFVAQTLRSSADIGLMTTALDIVKWDAALNNTTIFTRSSLDAISTPARLKDGSFAYTDFNAKFGLGWFIDDYYDQRNINHGGTFITGFHSEISRYVDAKYTIIILTNRVLSDPYFIGMHIAGMLDPALRIPHQLKPGQDADPHRSEKLRQFLLGVADGKVDSTKMTEGFRTRFSSEQRSDIAKLMRGVTSFSHIELENVEKRGIDRIGSSVSTLCAYNATTRAQRSFVSFYLTSEDKIADIWVYDAY